MHFVKDHKLIDEAHTRLHVNHVIFIVCFTNCFILGKLSNHTKWSISENQRRHSFTLFDKCYCGS